MGQDSTEQSLESATEEEKPQEPSENEREEPEVK